MINLNYNNVLHSHVVLCNDLTIGYVNPCKLGNVSRMIYNSLLVDGKIEHHRLCKKDTRGVIQELYTTLSEFSILDERYSWSKGDLLNLCHEFGPIIMVSHYFPCATFEDLFECVLTYKGLLAHALLGKLHNFTSVNFVVDVNVGLDLIVKDMIDKINPSSTKARILHTMNVHERNSQVQGRQEYFTRRTSTKEILWPQGLYFWVKKHWVLVHPLTQGRENHAKDSSWTSLSGGLERW